MGIPSRFIYFILLIYVTTSSQKFPDEKNRHYDEFYSNYGYLGVNFDMEHGKPFIKCEKYQKNEKDVNDDELTTKCFIDDGFLGQRLGCMGVYHFNVTAFPDHKLDKLEASNLTAVSKGCWNHMEVALEQCRDNEMCIATKDLEKKGKGILFCCCKKHMCNMNVHVNFTIDSSGMEATSGIGPLPFIGAFVFAFAAVAGVCVYVMWKCRGRSKEKLLLPLVTWTEMKKPIVKVNENMTLLTDRATDEPIHLDMLISAGKFGSVYKGTTASGKVVAVKVFEGRNSSSYEREKAVYDMFGKNQHPHLLKAIRTEVHEPNFWIVTDYIQNGSLEGFLKEHAIGDHVGYQLALSFLEGLAFLHEERTEGNFHKPIIVHRDLKSRNVLVRDNLTSVIGDFGLAMECDGGASEPKLRPIQVGTHRYMAPEMLEGATEKTASALTRMDVYSAGLVLWEICCRTRIFEHDIPPAASLPYDEEIPMEKRKDAVALRVIISQKKTRPEFRPIVTENPMTELISRTARDMWDHEPEARITASCALIRMNGLNKKGNGDEGIRKDKTDDRPNAFRRAFPDRPKPVRKISADEFVSDHEIHESSIDSLSFPQKNPSVSADSGEFSGGSISSLSSPLLHNSSPRM